ncbi:MAG: hypothetical protein R6V40_04310 [Candidatus Moraniibacteriota bacterium]
MGPKQKQIEIVDLMIQHELAIGDLYKTCVEIFPEEEKFWEEISSEERMHARWLEDLKEKIEKGTVYVNTSKFTPQSIKTSLQYIKEEEDEIQKGNSDLKKSFGLALDLENALLEGGNLKIFEANDSQLKHFLNFLSEETKEHAKKIKNKLEPF